MNVTFFLKTCPFCGDEAEFHNCFEMEEGQPPRLISDNRVGVHCKNCYISTLPFESIHDAVDVWNKRVVEIVKCRDCDDFNPSGCSEGCGWCENFNRGTFEESFCNNAKRRSDNG